MSIKLTNLVISNMAPIVDDPEVAKLLPKLVFPENCEFTINNADNAIANALRRTIGEELPVYSLYYEISDYATTDKFHIPEMIQRRFRMIPIMQDIPIDSIFEVDFTNTSPLLVDFKSSQIKIKNGPKELPFNDTYTLFTVNPGKSIQIRNIKIIQDYAYNFAGHILACHAIHKPLDQAPIDPYDDSSKGISVSLSNPKIWQLSFVGLGTMPAKKIIKTACENIIYRIKSISDIFTSIHTNKDEHILVLPLESHTIGNLLMRTICDNFADVKFVVYKVPSVERACHLRVRYDGDIIELLKKTIDIISSKFQIIQSQV